MEWREFDWSVLRGAALFLLSACVLSAGLFGASHYFTTQMKEEYRRHHADFLAASRRYIQLGDEEQLIYTYLPQYQQLMRLGVLGQEQRLNWTEALRAASDAVKLPAVRYDIHPQKSYAPAENWATGSYRISASRMGLTADLLHEEDLLRLFKELEVRAKGRFTVADCRLGRLRENITPEVKEPNLKAECNLLWTTMRQPQGGQS